MRPHSRIRRTIKWSGAAGPVLLGPIGLASGWRVIQYRSTHVGIAIAGGRLFANGIDQPIPPHLQGWSTGTREPRPDIPRWEVRYASVRVPGLWMVEIPLWW